MEGFGEIVVVVGLQVVNVVVDVIFCCQEEYWCYDVVVVCCFVQGEVVEVGQYYVENGQVEVLFYECFEI